jgi:hypothetical protein
VRIQSKGYAHSYLELVGGVGGLLGFTLDIERLVGWLVERFIPIDFSRAYVGNDRDGHGFFPIFQVQYLNNACVRV